MKEDEEGCLRAGCLWFVVVCVGVFGFVSSSLLPKGEIFGKGELENVCLDDEERKILVKKKENVYVVWICLSKPKEMI